MKLLIETLDRNDFNIIEESADKKSLYITGKFIQCDIVNKNKRIYPLQTVKAEIERYVNESVKNDIAIGELNHPEKPPLNPERACILITELVNQGSDYIGKAKVLESVALGQHIAGLIRDGVRLGVSTRAVGSVKRNAQGIAIVQSDFKLITAADVVLEPSAPEAYMTAIMENREWVYENGVLVEKEVKGLINKEYKAGFTQNQANELFSKIVNLIGAKS